VKLAVAPLGAVLLLPCSTAAQGSHEHGATSPSPPPASRPAAAEEPRVAVSVPPEKQGRMGLRMGRVERRQVRHVVRTVGTVALDETREAHVHTRYSGWIEELRANYVGRPVKRGETLCLVYSQELVAIQQEYLAARGKGGVAAEVAASALDRLRLLGVPTEVITRLEQGEKPALRIPIQSPIDGYVVEKTAIQGMYVTPDMTLYRLADLSRVWIVATLYESDLPVVDVGDEGKITLTHDPTVALTARLAYIYPDVTPETRTARARLEVANQDLRLKPGMYVNVEIDKQLGAVVVVPEQAVIDTGLRRIIFVKTSEERFEPREVKLGPRTGDAYAVLAGLRPGEEIVTSANFLIDAESRLQAALEKGLPAPGGHAGHGEAK
jgi:Cu(I)/Ag(I) efflux system membrane fusion protein